MKKRLINILLIKPYQPCKGVSHSPILGLLYLASTLREKFGDNVQVKIIDAKLREMTAEDLESEILEADIVGLNVLSYESQAAFDIARIAKKCDPKKIVALGGPYAHKRAEEILGKCSDLDWVFEGESERAFPQAVEHFMNNNISNGNVPSMFFRSSDGKIIVPTSYDFVEDLDSIPFPAWDLVDFDEYSSVSSQNGWIKGKRYSTIFTSRGCPYRCTYCHDVFGKRFRKRSPENVVAEMRLLIDKYGVDEFHVVDDIFNLDKGRVKKIFSLLKENYPNRQFHFCFPNGLRADILDKEVILALKEAGTYQVALAIETVTPRLQTLIEKNLKLNRTLESIRLLDEQGIIVKGFFMLGFPTETPQEIWNTIKFAMTSRLSLAGFFTVTPQPGTKIFDLALQEGPETIKKMVDNTSYYGKGWYEVTYGLPLNLIVFFTLLIFHIHPRRLWVIFSRISFKHKVNMVKQFCSLLKIEKLMYRKNQKRYGSVLSIG